MPACHAGGRRFEPVRHRKKRRHLWRLFFVFCCHLKSFFHYLCKVKIKLAIICSVFIALAACSSRYGDWHSSEKFIEIREMMKTSPADALFVLEQDTNHYNNPEYQLLLAEAHCLNNCPQNDGDELMSAVNYYDSLTFLYPKNDFLQEQKVKAYYFYGVKEFENDNFVNAVDHYFKALKTVKANGVGCLVFSKNDIKALIYNGLYDCLIANYCYYEAMECASRAQDFSEEKAEINNKIKFCNANVYFENGDYDSALRLFEELLKTSVKSDVPEYEYGVAKCYFCENELDSAIIHYERALSGNKRVVAAASADLVELYREKGDTTAVYFKYSDLFFSLYNNLNNGFSSTSKMLTLYHDFQNNEIIEKEQVRRKTLNFYVIIVILFFAVVSYYILRRYRNRKEKEYEKLRKDSEKKLNDIQKSMDRKKNVTENARKKAVGIDFSHRFNDFENREVCVLIKNRVEVRDVSRKTIADCYSLALNNREKLQLLSNVNSCFPDFSSLLVDNLGVKGENIVYSCLCLLGFSTSEVAALMKVSYQAANKRVNLIKEILKTDENVQDFLVKYLSNIYG